MMFTNRKEAGIVLAKRLSEYKNQKKVVVLGIPRGGVEVAFYVAKELGCELDIMVIKKVGFPNNEELALGAVSVDDYYIDAEMRNSYAVTESYIKEEVARKQEEARKRWKLLKGEGKVTSLKGKTVIVVDDGIATGSTMIMAIKMLSKKLCEKIIVAIPVAAQETIPKMKKIVDEVVCLEQPVAFFAIGQFYREFLPVEEEEVKRYLQEAEKWMKKIK